MKNILLLLALLPSLAFGQVLRRDTGTGTSGTFTTAPTFPGATSTGTVATKGLVSTALATPVNATFTATTGTLNNGTYYYRVSALDAAGETLASTETSLTVSGGAASNGVVVNWGAVTGAISYKVYGRSTGAELLMATVTAPTVTWTDNGSVTPSGALPALGTSGNISTVSGVTARDVTTSAASGAAAITMVSGSRFYIAGTGGPYCYGAASASLICNYYVAAPYFSPNSTTAIQSSYVVGIKAENASTDSSRIGASGIYSTTGTDASGTPGAATINKPAGQVSVDDTAASVVVTNSLVTTASIILPVLQFVDATCTQILSCVPAAGSFTITMNAACTAHTKIGFVVHNYF